MSVNAINAVEPQQKQSSPMGTALAAGAVTGLAGAGAGYLWGGGKHTPSLEEVFAQIPDEFTATMKKATDAGKEAKDVDAVKAGQQAYENAIKDAKNKLEIAQNDYDSHVNSIPDDVNDEVKNAKSDFDAKKGAKREVQTYNEKGEIEKNGDDVVKKELKASEMDATVKKIEKTIEAQTDDAKKTELKNNLAKVKEEYKAELEAMENAEKKLYEVKEKVMLATADAKDETKPIGKAVRELSTKKNELNTAKETAKKAITEETKNAFNNIKGALKEIKWGKLGIYGGIAAAVGLVAGYIMGNSKQA